MTASPGDGEHAAREGYYPDPSIPGYVRYWNGLSWVPGTSRPATPADRPGPAPLDETSVTEALPEPEPEPESEPEPGPEPLPSPSLPSARAAWQADPLRQSGFGGPHDHRVSWGGGHDPAGRPEPEPEPEPDPGHAPARPAGTAPGRGPHPHPEPPGRAAAAAAGVRGADSGVDRGPGSGPDRVPGAVQERGPGVSFARTPAASAAAAERYPAQGVGILSARSPVTGTATGGAAASVAPAPPWPTVPGSGADSGMTSSWPEATERRSPAAPAAPSAPRAEPRPGARPSPPTAAGRGAAVFSEAPEAPAPPGPTAPATSSVPPGVRGFPAGETPSSVPAQASRPVPEAPAPHGAPGPRQTPVTAPATAAPAAPAAPAVPLAPQPPERATDRAVFEEMAERAVRPAGPARRFAARALDTVVFGAVAAATARPLVPAATAHLQSKVDAARGTGRVTTVWLLDATITGYAGVVLGVLVVFGLLYEVLPTARWGRTPGKRLLGVRVLSAATYRPPGFGAALSRWLVGAFLGPVGALWCLTDRPRRRGPHDRAAGTYVAR
ncbi:RDD family protein [Streptomyces sp. NPDC059851]|uniref:RDD family protein n=1 Tax=Streptomyces sp. NPDC059851 TaxID=3346971 RepID=UPI003653B90F